MAIADLYFNFSDAQALTGTAAVLSTNVYDAGSAKSIFSGGTSDFNLIVTATSVAGTTPTLAASFVAADNAALTTNPITLASVGATAPDAAGNIVMALKPSLQSTAKRYYGIFYTQAGTTPTSTVNAEGTLGSGQSNLVR